MKIIDLIRKHPKNTPITDKRILYHLKRLGYIWDYSRRGLLGEYKNQNERLIIRSMGYYI